MAFGASHMTPTTVSAWAFGTKRTWRVLPWVTRFTNGPLAKHLIDRGYRWAEARCLQTNREAWNWMEDHLGAHVEARLEGMGTNGETFILLRRRL